MRFDPAMVEAVIGLAPRQLHAARPQPGPPSRHRRRSSGVLLGRLDAQQSFDREGGRRPGNHRRLPRFCPARPVPRRRAPLGRLPGRAHRHPRLGAPPRGPVRPADPVGQAHSRLQPRQVSATSMRSSWSSLPGALTTPRSSASRRCSPSSTPPRRCASTTRCAKASSRWPEAQSGGGADALHAGRRHGARHHRGCRHPAERRGAGRVSSWPRRCGRARRSSTAASRPTWT